MDTDSELKTIENRDPEEENSSKDSLFMGIIIFLLSAAQFYLFFRYAF